VEEYFFDKPKRCPVKLVAGKESGFDAHCAAEDGPVFLYKCYL